MVSHSAQPGGSNQVILSLLRHRPADVDCACVFLERGPILEQVSAGGVPSQLLDSGRARELWRAPHVVRSLRSTIRREQADVVFAHVTKAHLYAAPAARLSGKPYLWWQHEEPGQKPLMQSVSGRLPAAAVICSSHWTAAEQHTPPGGEVRVIHPGVEVDSTGAARIHKGGAGDRLAIGILGRLQRWKRVELAVKMMPSVLASLPEAELHVIGGSTPGIDDGYEQELRELAVSLDVARSVRFLGHVSDVGARLSALDVLVHAASTEPFGLAPVEALAAGVPVVAVDEGGPREIVRSGVDGLLVPATAQALASAVTALCADPELRTRMGAAGRELVLSEFSAQRMADDTWTLVRRVAARSSASV